MSTEVRSIAGDFGGSFASAQFHAEIVADAGITTTLNSIETVGDVVNIHFASSLSGGELTVLAGLISAHVVASNVVYANAVAIQPRSDSYSNSTYTRVGTYAYGGSVSDNPIRKVTAVGYMGSGVTSYSVRLYDSTNQLVIAEATFTNTAETLIDLGTVSNVPTLSAVLEAQIKKTGGTGNKKVYLDSMAIYS